ncbi:flavodoxin [candidate division MSBL1 archaeon SCGC-AAA259M10]|uniref:Flavodoxin n=1 Tax=candidate division MSBL1 archaeon SCGC-AAA259M10 TaxID=1698270 RepID=A0A133UYR5_9EURY|nr:flavodoxin [candidate division MSBL1 archaeon SCGC-AAA259M10]
METLIVYKSVHHGNTEKVAKSIAEVLEADLCEPEEFEVKELRGKDLVGFGSGIYNISFHESILELLEELPEMESKKAFIFSTSGLPRIPIVHDYESEVKEKLTEKGFEVVDSFSCRGHDTYFPVFRLFGGIHKDRPNEEDIDKAKKFAKQLIED